MLDCSDTIKTTAADLQPIPGTHVHNGLMPQATIQKRKRYDGGSPSEANAVDQGTAQAPWRPNEIRPKFGQ